MNLRPSAIKIAATILVFALLFVVDASSQCWGGRMTCEPSQRCCSLVEETHDIAGMDRMIEDACGADFDPLDCQNQTCHVDRCGGIGGLPVILGLTVVFYAVFSFFQQP